MILHNIQNTDSCLGDLVQNFSSWSNSVSYSKYWHMHKHVPYHIFLYVSAEGLPDFCCSMGENQKSPHKTLFLSLTIERRSKRELSYFKLSLDAIELN